MSQNNNIINADFKMHKNLHWKMRKLDIDIDLKVISKVFIMKLKSDQNLT